MDGYTFCKKMLTIASLNCYDEKELLQAMDVKRWCVGMYSYLFIFFRKKVLERESYEVEGCRQETEEKVGKLVKDMMRNVYYEGGTFVYKRPTRECA